MSRLLPKSLKGSTAVAACAALAFVLAPGPAGAAAQQPRPAELTEPDKRDPDEAFYAPHQERRQQEQVDHKRFDRGVSAGRSGSLAPVHAPMHIPQPAPLIIPSRQMREAIDRKRNWLLVDPNERQEPTLEEAFGVKNYDLDGRAGQFESVLSKAMRGRGSMTPSSSQQPALRAWSENEPFHFQGLGSSAESTSLFDQGRSQLPTTSVFESPAVREGFGSTSLFSSPGEANDVAAGGLRTDALGNAFGASRPGQGWNQNYMDRFDSRRDGPSGVSRSMDPINSFTHDLTSRPANPITPIEDLAPSRGSSFPSPWASTASTSPFAPRGMEDLGRQAAAPVSTRPSPGNPVVEQPRSIFTPFVPPPPTRHF